MFKRERDRARLTLSRIDSQEPRLARSWREVSSWARSLREVNWLVSGSVEGGTGVGSSCGESESIAAAWWWMDGWLVWEMGVVKLPEICRGSLGGGVFVL